MESRMTWLDKLLAYFSIAIVLGVVLTYCVLRLPWYAYGYYVFPKRCISRIDALYDSVGLEWEEVDEIVRRANQKWDGKILTLSGRFLPISIPLPFTGFGDTQRMRLITIFSELSAKKQVLWRNKKNLQESGEIDTGQSVEEIESERKRLGYTIMYCKLNPDNARLIEIKETEISLGFWEGVFEPAFAYRDKHV